MAQYRYGGTEPVPDGETILRPLDVREFDEPPGVPWEPVDDAGDEPLPLDVPLDDEPAAPAKGTRGKGEK